MLILFHTVSLLVVIAAFMAEHSLSYSYICRFFMQSTPFLNFLLLLFFFACAIYLDHFRFGIILACQVGIICGPGAFARL